MPELTLEWTENGQQRHTTITDNRSTKHPGTYRIGRHPDLCDLVLSDRTVSGLHVEIFYNSHQQQFYVRNLRPTNPPTVDRQLLPQGEMPLKMGTILTLGQIVLEVTSIKTTIPSTFVVNHPPQTPSSRQTPSASTASKIPSTGGGVYMLRCPSCGRDCPREWMESRVGCRWCGCSLDAGMSVFVPRQK